MPNYNKVQFISWEIHTGMKRKATTAQDNTIGYSGLDNQLDDIKARVEFTNHAIQTAKKAIQDTGKDSSETLKVFVAPEFLYRGIKGAYLYDYLAGWPNPVKELGKDGLQPWEGLFKLLQNLVSSSDFKDWVFVFGSAIGAVFPEFSTLTPKPTTLEPQSLTAQSQKVDNFVNDKPLNKDPDSKKNAYQSTYIDNMVLIQYGGENNKDVNYFVSKRYTSEQDFYNYSPSLSALFKSDQTPSANSPIKPDAAIAKIDVLSGPQKDKNLIADLNGVNEGEVTFTLPVNKIDKDSKTVLQKPIVLDKDSKPIVLGVEICLDHLQSQTSPDHGRIKATGVNVRLQIVPSGGMSLKAASISLDPTLPSYAVNCDGVTTIDNASLGSHTQIWTNLATDKIEANNGENAIGTNVLKLENSLEKDASGKNFPLPLDANILWNNNIGQSGAGSIRIIDARPL